MQFIPYFHRDKSMNLKLALAVLLSALLATAAPMSLQADMVDTTRMLDHGTRNAQLALVESFMARQEVRTQMESLGVDPVMASARVAGLTDSQLQQLTLEIENAPAGGSALAIIGAVVLIVFILELLGVTNISHKI